MALTLAQLAVYQRCGRLQSLRCVLKLAERLELDSLRMFQPSTKRSLLVKPGMPPSSAWRGQHFRETGVVAPGT